MNKRINRVKLLYLRYKWLVVALGIFAIIIVALMTSACFVPDFTYENRPKQVKGSSNSLKRSKLYCYLDVSPSMLGFFDVAENNMEKFADALEKLSNKDDLMTQGAPYICGKEVIQGSESNDFFERMRTLDLSQYFTHEASYGITPDEVMDLSMIFTDKYNNGGSYVSDEDAVNVIITDLNFLRNTESIDEHNSQMNSFAEQLAEASKESNLCIYNIESEFSGTKNVDELDSDWEDDKDELDSNHSFFVIILAKDKYYDTFISELEKRFEEVELKLSDKKFELKNNMFTNHNIKIDRNKIMEISKNGDSAIESLNPDNKSVKNLVDHALGFRINYSGKEASGFSKLLIQELNIPGIYFNNDENSSQIEADVKTYYCSGYQWSYNEYTRDDYVTIVHSRILEDGGKYWLSLDMELNREAVPDKSVWDLWGINIWGKRITVIDIRLNMVQPQYTIPEWASEIEANEVTTDWSKKISFVSLLEKIESVKEEAYQEVTTEEQRWIGNILIYIFY